jgi:hypothetical protein
MQGYHVGPDREDAAAMHRDLSHVKSDATACMVARKFMYFKCDFMNLHTI